MIFYFGKNKIQGEMVAKNLQGYLKREIKYFSFQDILYDFKPSLVIIDSIDIHSKTLKKLAQQYPCSTILISDRSFKNISFTAILSEGGSVRELSHICQSLLLYKNETHDRQLDVVEAVILKYICNGHSNREIAKRLDYPVSKVKYYLRKIYDQLNVKNRTQAAMIARDIIL